MTAHPLARRVFAIIVPLRIHPMSCLHALLYLFAALFVASPARAETRLIQLISDGKIAAAKRLILSGANVNAHGGNGMTALERAAFDNQLDIAKLLIDKGADVNARDKSGFVPLVGAHTAAMAALLIEHGADVNAPSDSCATPLYFAANDRHKAVAELLIARGADVNARSRDGSTLLLSIQDPDMTALLIAHGARVNPGGTQDQPLSRAAHFGQTKRVAVLLTHGADVHAVTVDGSTPVHAASNPEIAALLLAYGADINARNERGETPLHSVLNHSNFSAASYLIDYGADLSARDDFGETPLHAAARFGTIPLLKQLIAKGADVKARNYDTESAYNISVAWNAKDKPRIAFLASQGADTATPVRTPRDQLPQKMRARLDALDRHLAALNTSKAVMLPPGTAPPQHAPTGWQSCGLAPKSE